MAQVSTAGTQGARCLWRSAAFILAFNSLYLAFLLVRPAGHAAIVAVDDLANVLGPLLALPLCFGKPWPWQGGRAARSGVANPAQAWAPFLLGLGILSFAVGQGIWSYYEVALHHATPFSSWADAGYLGEYPLFIAGILLLPGRRLSLASRVRALLDSLMTMTAVVTIGWYVLLGPLLLHGCGTPFAKGVAMAYPLGDLVLCFCLLLLAGRSEQAGLRRGARVLALGLGILAAVNGVYDYQLLHGTYHTGELIDPGWALGLMLIGLGAARLRTAMAGADSASGHDGIGSGPEGTAQFEGLRLWESVLPYTLVPVIGALLMYMWRNGSDDSLEPGVYVGIGALVLLVVLRQILMSLENRHLYTRLNAAYAAQGQDLAQRVAELEWLREIGQRVNAVTRLDEVLDVVYDGIHAGLGYDRVGIQIIDHARGLFEERRGTDDRGRMICPTDRSFPLAEGSPILRFQGLGALLGGAEFYYTPDIYAETPPELRYLCDGMPAHTLVVPLRSGHTMTGAISVDNMLSGRSVTPDDAGPLLALANQVGTAVENARLLERERAERARLEVLLDSARALNSTLDWDQVLRALAERLVVALDAASAAFTQIDFTTRTITSLAHHAAPHRPPLFATPQESVASLDHYPVIEHMMRTRVPLYGHADDPGFPPEEAAFLRARGLQAELLVPVVVRGQATSMFGVHWDRPVTIGADTVALCMAIAEQAAVALANAHLFAETAARAERDALTGLLNHRALLERLDSAVAAAAPFTMVLIDVDNFKLFNDTYGHQTGDAILCTVAATLEEACREGDVAARYGGDEFALLLRGVTEDDARAVMRRLADAVRRQPYVTPDGAIIPLSISAGIAAYPLQGQTRQELVAVADNAMYVAKRRTGSSLPAEEGALVARRWTDVPRHAAADLLGDSPIGVLEGLVNAVDAKDRYTREHSDDVTHLALLLADALGLDAEQRQVLAIAGPLHDVGKIAVPDRILRKPGRLTDEEYEAIKSHVAYGLAIIRGVLDNPAVIDAIAYHHERWDGHGYPYGLPGPRTPLLGRIMQVADAVSAMMLDRPYRQGLPWARVVAELRAGAGTQFDPALVEAFIAVAGTPRDRAAS